MSLYDHEPARNSQEHSGGSVWLGMGPGHLEPLLQGVFSFPKVNLDDPDSKVFSLREVMTLKNVPQERHDEVRAFAQKLTQPEQQKWMRNLKVVPSSDPTLGDAVVAEVNVEQIHEQLSPEAFAHFVNLWWQELRHPISILGMSASIMQRSYTSGVVVNPDRLMGQEVAFQRGFAELEQTVKVVEAFQPVLVEKIVHAYQSMGQYPRLKTVLMELYRTETRPTAVDHEANKRQTSNERLRNIFLKHPNPRILENIKLLIQVSELVKSIGAVLKFMPVILPICRDFPEKVGNDKISRHQEVVAALGNVRLALEEAMFGLNQG